MSAAARLLASVPVPCIGGFRSCSRHWQLLFLFLAARHRADDLHCITSALHRAGRLHQQSTMPLSGVSGSTAGYANLIAIFVISVIDILYLRDSTCHVLLVSTCFILMMTLMMNSFDKHIHDIMFMHFLFVLYLWNKLNMNLSNFLTDARRPSRMLDGERWQRSRRSSAAGWRHGVRAGKRLHCLFLFNPIPAASVRLDGSADPRGGRRPPRTVN